MAAAGWAAADEALIAHHQVLQKAALFMAFGLD